MKKRFTKRLLVLGLAGALTGVTPAAHIALGQQKKPGSKPDRYPTLF